MEEIGFYSFCYPILCLVTNVQAGELLIGTAQTDITPSLPAAIMGQFYLRVADSVESPLTANVIALESHGENNVTDIAIMVSCDLAQSRSVISGWSAAK